MKHGWSWTIVKAVSNDLDRLVKEVRIKMLIRRRLM